MTHNPKTCRICLEPFGESKSEAERERKIQHILGSMLQNGELTSEVRDDGQIGFKMTEKGVEEAKKVIASLYTAKKDKGR